MNNISIIIPILNEAEVIENLLKHLLENSSKKNIAELIVVDGGSTDGSQNIVSIFFQKISKFPQEKKYCLVESSKGRATQMNTGSGFASGNILYFLHADSFPPKNFDQYIINEIEKGNKAGCFKMKFNRNHWWLNLAGWLTKFNWKACRGGDQSLFIAKELFDEIGGFDVNYTIYEDIDLINKLYKKQMFIVIQQQITTSARRYKTKGIWNLQYHFWAIYVKKWLGASAGNLNRYYEKHVA